MINFLEELDNKFKLPLLENGKGFKVIYLINGVYLEGHLGIISLSENQISFKLKKGLINFFGYKLEISKIDKDSVLIKGLVIKIEREGANVKTDN